MESEIITIITSFSILLLIAAFTSFLGNYIKIPYTILLVMTGFIASQLGDAYPNTFQTFTAIEINPEIILYACLPTLLFESAFTLDARLLRYNIIPVLILAIPGLFLSTLIIGSIVYLGSSLNFMIALLLGAILSATDPVAVISLFKQLGVPKRLTILVEGESLFNDSTAIVTAKTILFIMAAGTISGKTFLSGGFEFCWQFFGGIVAGYLMAKLTGYVVKLFQGDHVIELTLILLLVYLSYLIADQVLHVSGVMATISAAIVMGDWGRSKISPIAMDQLHTILEVLAYIANALIFLMVGFSVHFATIFSTSGLLAVVIVAMLISRAIVIYGLTPIVSLLPNTDVIDARYQTIMWWGGLRGAIALAIVLGLKDMPDHNILIAVVMGAVLFTILVQGLTINWVIQKTGLNKPLIPDIFAKIEAEISAERATLARIPELQTGGLFSHKLALQLTSQSEKNILKYKDQLSNLRKTDLGKDEERKLLYLSCFAAEKYLYYKMFVNAHLDEQTYLALVHDLNQKIDTMRYKGDILESRTDSLPLKLYTWLVTKLSHSSVPFINQLADKLKISDIIADYEIKWGLLQGCITVLNHLDEMAALESIDAEITNEVRNHFQSWITTNKNYLDSVTNQFPEFVTNMQQRLGERLLLHTKRHVIDEQVNNGLLTEGLAHEIMQTYLTRIMQTRQSSDKKLRLDPHELIRSVPFFRSMPASKTEEVIKLLKEYHAGTDEIITHEGQQEDNLYIILRGVVRVIKNIHGQEVELATLMAGDFFGELAMLHGTKRTASCKAVTPCVLYTLSRKDFDIIKEHIPEIQQALETVAQERNT